MVMGEVKIENGAVLEMRTSHKAGLNYRNLIPRTTPYEVIIWCNEPLEFCCYKQIALIHLRGEEVP
jgi:hypothetical protein